MLRTILVTIMLAGLATTAVAETVYKWVDAKSQVHYTDRPPTQSDARLLAVLEREHNFIPADEEPSDDSNSPPPPDEPATSGTVAGVQRDVDQARSEQCKQAQERYKTYVESRRLYRQTADGKREYLSDEELMKARIDARQAVDDYCG